MKKVFYHSLSFIVTILFLSLNLANNAFANFEGDEPLKKKDITLPIPPKKPLPRVKLFKNDDAANIKTVYDEEKGREIKYTEDNAVIDCIRYDFIMDNKTITTGVETEIKVRLEYYSGLNMSWRNEDCQKLSIKVVFPKGFVQTGGTYYDFINVNFEDNERIKELSIKGIFYTPQEKATFLLLKGPIGSNWETIFIKKKEISKEVIGEDLSKFNSKIKNNDITDITKSDSWQSKEGKFESSVAAICPTPTTSAVTRCGTGTVTLTATGCTGAGATLTWYTTATGATVAGTTTTTTFVTPNFTATGTYTYSVTCTSSTCSPVSARSTALITIANISTPTITQNPNTTTAPICEGTNVTLTANNITGATYSWVGPNSFTSTSRTPIITAPNTNSIYTLTRVTAAICSVTATTQVFTTPRPSPPTLTGAARCGTGTVTLSAANCTGGTINWCAA
jgi:hypothetical protein